MILVEEKKKKSDSEFLSYNLMLNSGKKNRALRNKTNKYSNSRVVRKKILNEAKNHNPPPPSPPPPLPLPIPPCKLNGRFLTTTYCHFNIFWKMLQLWSLLCISYVV